MKLKYELGDNIGEMEIVDVIDGKSYPTISFLIEGKIHNISQNNINPYMTNLFKIIYKVGDVVNGLKILNINGKTALVQCEKDGYEFEIEMSLLKKGNGCPVCNKRIIVKGINDFNTTNPELVKYLKNKEDGYSNFYGSAKLTMIKCPNCGFEKQMSFNMLTEKGFSCPVCSDGISFGEKYFANFLIQCDVYFETQKTFAWSKQKRYDFFLPDYNCIVEIHGLQHYKETSGNWKKTLREQQDNDKFKENIAKEHGIEKYIVIDCSRSDGLFLKNNIIHSELIDFLKMDNVNWNNCLEATMKSKVYECADLWNKGLSVSEIADVTFLSTAGVRKYLKQATVFKIANYKPSQGEHLHCK